MKSIVSINPATGEVVGEVAATALDAVPAIIDAAREAQRGWSAAALSERIKAVHGVVGELLERKEEFAATQTREMGMAIAASIANVERAADFLTFYADSVEAALAPQVTYEKDGEKHTVMRVARGVHASVFPWNFPFSNMAWSCGQSLLVGNAVVLKMSDETPLSAQNFADVLTHHLPTNVFTMIYGDGTVGRKLVEQKVDFVSFTGSTATGHAVYRAAAENLVPCVLELGGSAPGIVCADADLATAIPKMATARLGNAGQRCDGLKRLIVHESIVDATVSRLRAEFAKQVVGDPLATNTTIGPLASKKQQSAVIRQLQDARERGAKFEIGNIADENEIGAYVEPVLLTNVNADMRVWNEEVFAPVLPVMSFSTEDEAIALANNSEYGLGSHLYTSDPDTATRLAGRLETGMVSVNAMIYTRPWNPFGGVKASGFGREHGVYGFHELTSTKVIASNL